jgi:hypothetical protein
MLRRQRYAGKGKLTKQISRIEKHTIFEVNELSRGVGKKKEGLERGVIMGN